MNAKKKAAKKTSAVEVMPRTAGSFVKVRADGRKVLSDNLGPGERKLNDTEDNRYLLNTPTIV